MGATSSARFLSSGTNRDGVAEGDEPNVPFVIDGGGDGSTLDGWSDDLFVDENGDDLLAALDELEAEARADLVRRLACPEFDALELLPMAGTAYRSVS